MATRKERQWTVHSVMIRVAYVQSQNKSWRRSKVLYWNGKQRVRNYSHKYLINS
jgi:hypothetical protein